MAASKPSKRPPRRALRGPDAVAAQPGQHITVLLAEAVDAVAHKPDGIYVDGTFGRGGNSRALLARLMKGCRCILFFKRFHQVTSMHVSRTLSGNNVIAHERIYNFKLTIYYFYSPRYST